MGKLTALTVKNKKETGRYFDGNGLSLQITKAGSKSWIYRFQINKKSREMGLGSYTDVGLAEARNKRDDARRLVKQGVDPIGQREVIRREQEAAERKIPTFDECAAKYIDTHNEEWCKRHHRQWSKSLEKYASPVIGNIPVDAITTDDVLKVIKPAWTTKRETMSRVRNRIELVLDLAKASKFRTGENPAVWRGNLKHLLPSHSKKRNPVKHFPALPYADAPTLMGDLADDADLTSKLLRFIILTAVRANEACGADWSEVDLDKALWVIPAHRMKAGVEHQVPLAEAALDLLENLPTRQGWLFPSARLGKHVSSYTPLKLLKTFHPDVTTHGFRSTFSDWAGEQTSAPSKIIDQCLAHKVGDATTNAYQRSKLVEKRRALMQEWSEYIIPGRSQTHDITTEKSS